MRNKWKLPKVMTNHPISRRLRDSRLGSLLLDDASFRTTALLCQGLIVNGVYAVFRYISLSGLVDFPEFEHTGVAVIDWLFHVWGASAIGDVDYAVSDAAHEASVVKHVTANFVPTFASDANTGSFAAQGKSLIRRLEALGVETASDFPASERLFHNYELNLMGETESAKHTVNLQVAFIHHLLADE